MNYSFPLIVICRYAKSTHYVENSAEILSRNIYIQFNAPEEEYLRQEKEHTPITREGSITELVENFPMEIPRTFSDSYLPRGRPPN